MKTLALILKEKFEKAAAAAFPELDSPVIEVTQATNEKFGHYQFNSAMRLAKSVGKNPRAIAEEIVLHLEKDLLIQSLEIAGPGFVNITLSAEQLSERVQKIYKSARLEIPETGKGERLIIDFSSPNVAKELHVGHLRSTIIGDSLARLFEFLGYDVLRLNHIGDWGTAFGMLIAYLKENAPEVIKGEAATDLPQLVAWYKESKQQFDHDAAFKKRAQLEVTKLQGGETESLEAWKIICGISSKAYREIYKLLGIEIEDRGESFYNPMLPSIVKELEEKGLVTVSEGAKCVFIEGFQNREGEPLPMIVQKSDGGYNYDTTDMAAIKQRIVDEGGTRLVYVTDAGQATHFRMIFEAAKKAGWLDSEKVRTDHVPFGLVLGEDGKKFRTRSGETEKLIDLLFAAVERANEILAEKLPDMEPGERKRLAEILGIDAVKYADLSCHRKSDYTFSYDRMLRFEGNTAPYLLYAYVRVAGIKRKVGADVEKAAKSGRIALQHPSEIALGLHLARFSEALEQASEELLPNRLTDYLYALAEKFNAFYRDCRIEGAEEQESRLLLSECAARTLKQGLEILGLKTVERM